MAQTKTRPTPEQAAAFVRSRFDSSIAKTIEEETSWGRNEKLFAYEAAKLVEEQAGCNFRTASDVVEKIIPELFAGYWDDLVHAEEGCDA